MTATKELTVRHAAAAVALTAALLAPVPAVAQESPSPAASSSPSPSGPSAGTTPTPEPCSFPSFTSSFSPAAVTAGQSATYTLTITGPVHRAGISLSGYQWSSPTQRADIGGVRGGTYDGGSLERGETATVTLTAAPSGNARVAWSGAVYCNSSSFHGDHFASNPAVLDVAPRHTLTASRNGTRDYTFSGTSTRPGMVLNLYRVNADGSQVLTSQTRTTQAQTWSIRRQFTGAGRFGFVLRTGRDLANAPGVSNTRPTLIF